MRFWYLSHRRGATAQASQVKTRQNLCCWHTWSIYIDEGSEQMLYLQLSWIRIRQHVHLLEAFIRGEIMCTDPNITLSGVSVKA